MTNLPFNVNGKEFVVELFEFDKYFQPEPVKSTYALVKCSIDKEHRLNFEFLVCATVDDLRSTFETIRESAPFAKTPNAILLFPSNPGNSMDAILHHEILSYWQSRLPR